jgi:ABC-type multidrug transport system ATPase subunit
MRCINLHQLLLFIAAAAVPSAAEPPLAPCARDIQNLCPAAPESTIQQLYTCLQQSYDQLSQECKAALGAAVPGGCEADAQRFCSSNHTVPDILACLRDHKDELSEVCIHNMQQRKQPRRPANGFLRFEPPRITRTFALVTVLVLVVPLCVCAWAVRKMILFTRENQAFLSKCERWALRSQLFRAQVHGDGSGSPNPNPVGPADDSTAQHEISFVYVNFWSLSRNSALQLKRQKKQILHDISARFMPCEVTAIMGPSGTSTCLSTTRCWLVHRLIATAHRTGCGKTTLLNLIGGHSVAGEFSGVRMVDGKAYKVGRYDELIRQQGFVKQGDLLFDNLTVWETLAFAANLRLPDRLSIQQKLERAMQIIQQMGLLAVASHVVGKPGGKGGISGGQRRRLSIALELLRLPSVLMLDEPTSGLDATASLRLVQLLHDMAKSQHRTVVTTIHQPRAEVFELFDRILLLGVGGYMIYFGSVRTTLFLGFD